VGLVFEAGQVKEVLRLDAVDFLSSTRKQGFAIFRLPCSIGSAGASSERVGPAKTKSTIELCKLK
jgi:hypothetical protein